MDERELVAFCKAHSIHPLSLRLLRRWSRTRDGARFVLGASLGVMPIGKPRKRGRSFDRIFIDELV